ncbi:MAG: hypothetical protein ISS82_04380 [Nanoarchaeota archaeon]|nr:hypothetical protein [Nanoarchaeota archaeon]
MIKERKKILIVDRGEGNLKDITDTLVEHGYEIVTASNKHNGMDLFRRNGFGMVITNEETLPESIKSIKPKLPILFYNSIGDDINVSYSLVKARMVDELIFPNTNEFELLSSIENNMIQINVGIVGIGNVGRATAHQLVKERYIENLILIGDIRKGDSLKRKRSIEDVERNAEELFRIHGVDKDSIHVCRSLEEAASNTDIMIVCLKSPDYDYRKLPSENIRRVGLEYDLPSIISLAEGLEYYNYQGLAWLISNPISEFCSEFLKLGFNPQQIIGSSSDTDRLQNTIVKYYNKGRTVNLIGNDNVTNCYVIGDHKGGSMIPVFSNIIIHDPERGQLNIADTKLKNSLEEITQEVNEAGLKTIHQIDGAVAPEETSEHIRATLRHIVYEGDKPIVVIGYYKGDSYDEGAFVALPAKFKDLRIESMEMPNLSETEMNQFVEVYRNNLELIRTPHKKESRHTSNLSDTPYCVNFSLIN